jgi:superfamily I DNA/RNA helicase/Txe/YoeB family toxin of Txe-Axe toxin-antitoxin module
MSSEFLRDLVSLPQAISKKAGRLVGEMLSDPWARQFHPEKVERAEPGVHSCRVDDDYRLIWKHIKPNHILFCLLDNHDEAYRRARRKSFALEDGVVRVADVVETGAAPADSRGLFGWFRPKEKGVGALFAGYRDSELFDIGVPEDALSNVRCLNDVNELPSLERLLTVDVYDGLLEIALGVVDRPVVPDRDLAESLEKHEGGDELRMFVDSEEFKRALQGDLEDWMLFLAPQQRDLAKRDYSGPARIKGVSGSGKTVVAVHRARHLAQKTGGKNTVLFVTFGNRLPQVNKHLLQRLAGPDAPELDAVECATIHEWCRRFLRANDLIPNVDDKAIQDALQSALQEVTPRFAQLSALWRRPQKFFADEIRYAIKGRAVNSLDDYLSLERSGRGTALGETERRAVWQVYEAYQKKLEERGFWDWEDFILRSLRLVEEGRLRQPYTAAVVDEIQDLTEANMRLLRAIVSPGHNDLFLVGDGLQRLFRGGYTLSRIGIDIVGRSSVLRRNYRNTQEILRAAFTMMKDVHFNDLDDQESVVEEPEYSPRHGPVPELRVFATPEVELEWLADEIGRIATIGEYRHGDFAVLYRQRRPYRDLIQQRLGGKFSLAELSKDATTYFGPDVKHSTFDSAKGLEFKVVFVVGVTDGRFVPRDDWSLDGPALVDYLARERSRLFVAMTRARDRLYLSCARGQPSRFLSGVPDQYLLRNSRV